MCQKKDKLQLLAMKILEVMLRPNTIAYYYMLQHVLGELNKLNKLFQTERVIIDIVDDEIQKVYKNIAGAILSRSYIRDTKIEEIDILRSEHYVSWIDMELGDGVKHQLIMHGDDMKHFCQSAFSFIVALSLELKQRFANFQNPVYNAAKCFHPANALSIDFHEQHKDSFESFINCFQNLIHKDNLNVIRCNGNSSLD